MAPSSPSTDATRQSLLDWGQERLSAAERDAPRRTAMWLLAELLDCDRGHLYAHSQQTVEAQTAQRFRRWVRRRAKGEPLEHILGYANFRGLQIEVAPDVMIPRPETEEVVSHALSAIKQVEAPRVLDVGTGSGCIALALKHERPAADIHACDVSTEALAVAQRNAHRLGDPVDFTEADVLQSSFLAAVDPPYDLIVSNPPYIPDAEADTLPATVRDYDPPQALFAGADPLRFYRALARVGREGTRPGGAIVLEVHASHGQEVAALLRSQGTSRVSVETDMAGRERVVLARWPGTSSP